MGKWLISMMLAALLPTALAAGELIADFDFGKAGKQWSDYGKNQFAGPLPEGLQPDFSWNKSVVGTELVSEGNRKFTRFKVTSFDGVQFNGLIGKFAPNATYKIDVVSRGAAPLGVQLRQGPPPYNPYFSATTTTGLDRFTTSTHYATLGADAKDAGFFLGVKPGGADLLRLKITKVTLEELQAEIQRPAKGAANFFRDSRFPLGLQSGWNLHPAFEAGAVEPDATNPGPSGSPSLKIRIDNMEPYYGGQRAVALLSEPFQTSNPAVKNHVAFAYQSSGDWSARLTDNFGRAHLDMHILANQKLPATKGWTTARLDFTPDPMAQSFTLALAGKGTLWLDSLRAWAGDGDGSYVSQGECEVALAFPRSDASLARIQFADEPAALAYCVTDGFDGATLKTKVVDLYGAETPLADQNLGRSWLGELLGTDTPTLERGTLDFSPALADKPLGQFRVEAWVERDGKRVSPLNEMVVTRVHRPLHWGEDAPNSPFGCHFSASPVTIPMMKAAGVNWVRLHDTGTAYLGWYHLEPEKGQWRFRDDAIMRYRDGKIKIMGDLQTAPRWASSISGHRGNPYFDAYWTVKDWDAWTNYVKTVCSRYKGVIDGYYVWNEPCPDAGAGFYHDGWNGQNYTMAMEDAARGQARLGALASKAAKEVDPSVKISGPNFNNSGATAFNQALVAEGSFNHCDLADYHVYVQSEVGYPDDALERNYKHLLGPLLATGFNKPIDMSEGTGGWGPAEAGLYKHSVPWEQHYVENARVSDEVCRFVARLLSLKVERVMLYSASYSYLGVPLGCFTLVNQDGYPHPSLAAFSNLAWLLEERKFVECVPVGEKVWAYLFAGRGGTVAVISGLSNGKYTVPKSSDWKTVDLFGNPSDGVYKGNLLYVKSPLPADKLATTLPPLRKP